MFRFSLLLLLLGLNNSVAAENQVQPSQNQDAKLTQRCLNSFEFIEQQDVQAYIAEMPGEYYVGQEKRLQEILNRSHKRWFERGNTKPIEVLEVTYHQPSEIKKERFGAIEEARIKLYIVGDSFTAYANCKYLRTSNGWFLFKLP
ncbi:hypothetical protein [Shewanella donghaensis]|uniref:hypothetical protein n=1 Tax=Shewanella donghaensis TaxID=238836 RepID=UPI0011845A78|nr:hypothetical protein [Shewanella donghaensis]